jgi:hypothetical protein
MLRSQQPTSSAATETHNQSQKNKWWWFIQIIYDGLIDWDFLLYQKWKIGRTINNSMYL